MLLLRIPLLTRLLDAGARNNNAFETRQKSLRKYCDTFFATVNVGVTRGHQRSNLAKFRISSETCHYLRNRGCGIGVETGVGVGRSRQFCPESESELGSVKFCGLRLRFGVAGHHRPSTDEDFDRTVMHRPEDIETQEEKLIGSVEIKLKRHSVIDSIR